MPNPTVSIIIPTYNRAAQLEAAIGSVLAQTFEDFELIIIDDGSQDNTAEVVQQVSRNSIGGERILYFFQNNQGQAIATNEGLRRARGEWIAFLDSDDFWLPTKLAVQMDTLRRYYPAAEACFTDARYVNNPSLTMTAFERGGMSFQGETGVLEHGTRFLLVEPHGIYVQSLVMRTSLLKTVEVFDSKLRIFLDKDFIFRLSHATTFCFVNCPLLQIDRAVARSEGLIELFKDEGFRLSQLQYLYQKWLSLAWLEPRDRSTIAAKLGSLHSGWASLHLFNQDYKKARMSISVAVRAERSLKSLMKYLLIAVSPSLARKIVVGQPSGLT